MRRVAWLASVACSLYAAEASLEGPMLGYVNTATGVRRVLGVVGSARLSAPVTGELQGAEILAGAGAAVAKNPSGALVRVDLKGGSLASLGVEHVDTFVVSPSGNAILASAAGKVHALLASGHSKISVATPGAARLMAISDDGLAIAFTVAEGEGDALYAVNAQGAAQRVFHSPHIAALAFGPGSRDAFFAAADGRIYRLTSDLQFTAFSSLQGITALAGIPDGRVIAIAGNTITALSADGSVTATAECPCQGTVARPLGQSKYLLTAPEQGPMWIVDGSAAELRVAFIPEAVNE